MPLPTEANVSRPTAAGYEALIEYGDTDAESLYLRLAPAGDRQMVLETVVEEQLPDLASNPEELRSESGRTFGRDDFSGGEGLDRAHRRDGTDSDSTRFWFSSQVDVQYPRGGKPSKLTASNQTASIRSNGGTNRATLVRIDESVGPVLYGLISSPTLVDRTADPTVTSPTWSTENPGGSGNIGDIAALGLELYAARGEIRKRDSSGTWAAWSDLAATRIWGVKGRIVASTGDALYEAAASTGSTLLHTLPNGAVWNDVCDAGGAILAAASDGYIYAFVEENGELSLKGQTLMEGETPTALAASQGLVFIGTSEETSSGVIGRLWRSVLVGLRLREGQVLRKWGDGDNTWDASPKRIVATRDAIYTAVVGDNDQTHVWKYSLETGGMFKHLFYSSAAVVHGLESFDDRLLANLDGEAHIREQDVYETGSYLISPAADFFTAAKKTWVGARLQTGELPADTSVTLSYSTDPAVLGEEGSESHASWVDVITATSGSPGDGVEVPITGVESRFIIGKITLNSDPAFTATPEVYGFAFRGKATATEEDVPLVVNLSDRLELPGKRPLTVDGVGDAVYEKLLDLKGDNVTLTLLRPVKVYKGQIVRVRAPIVGVPRQGSPTTYGVVWVRGQLQ